jgi:hypothetical protein
MTLTILGIAFLLLSHLLIFLGGLALGASIPAEKLQELLKEEEKKDDEEEK